MSQLQEGGNGFKCLEAPVAHAFPMTLQVNHSEPLRTCTNNKVRTGSQSAFLTPDRPMCKCFIIKYSLPSLLEDNMKFLPLESCCELIQMNVPLTNIWLSFFLDDRSQNWKRTQGPRPFSYQSFTLNSVS